MELYKKFPKLCAGWCFLEILLYAGQLFGWSAIQFVLKEEGFYANLCDQSETKSIRCSNFTASDGSKLDYVLNPGRQSGPDEGNDLLKTDNVECILNVNRLINIGEKKRSSTENILTSKAQGADRSLISLNQNLSVQIGQSSFSTQSVNYYDGQSSLTRGDVTQENSQSDALDNLSRGCFEQDARLNLWFSIAICLSYSLCSVMGPVLQRTGMRVFRSFSICLYVFGALCLGFATKETPWLVAPGLSCIGISGMALYATNIHVSYLFPSFQSTITSGFVGLYDASTVMSFLMKVAHENGISRKYFYIGLAVFHLLFIGTSTFILLPAKKLKPKTSLVRADSNKQAPPDDKMQNADDSNEKAKFLVVNQKSGRSQNAIYRSLCSVEYVLHVYWMCCQGLRFVTFLGFFNTWLEMKFEGNAIKESYYLGVFSYVTLGTAITAITAGMLHDCQRRQYCVKGDYQRRRLPIILPLVVTSLLSLFITSLTFVKMEIFINFVFVLFTIYRSYLFSYEITFLNDIYPLTTFPVLFGVLHSSAGLAGMLQYPLFEWYKSYPEAPNHVNYFMIGLAVSSLAHPLYIWYRCRRHKGNTRSALEILV